MQPASGNNRFVYGQLLHERALRALLEIEVATRDGQLPANFPLSESKKLIDDIITLLPSLRLKEAN